MNLRTKKSKVEDNSEVKKVKSQRVVHKSSPETKKKSSDALTGLDASALKRGPLSKIATKSKLLRVSKEQTLTKTKKIGSLKSGSDIRQSRLPRQQVKASPQVHKKKSEEKSSAKLVFNQLLKKSKAQTSPKRGVQLSSKDQPLRTKPQVQKKKSEEESSAKSVSNQLITQTSPKSGSDVQRSTRDQSLSSKPQIQKKKTEEKSLVKAVPNQLVKKPKSQRSSKCGSDVQRSSNGRFLSTKPQIQKKKTEEESCAKSASNQLVKKPKSQTSAKSCKNDHQMEKTVNKKKIDLKEPKSEGLAEVLKRNTSKSSPVNRIRRRQNINYAESSLETTQNESQVEKSKKVPIYKQPLKEKSSKRKGDLYDFDSDSERQNKKRKKHDSDSTSDEYNRTIQNILKNIKNKSKKNVKKTIYTDPKKTTKKKKVQIKKTHNQGLQNMKLPVVLLERLPVDKLQKPKIDENQEQEKIEENHDQEKIEENEGEDACFGFDLNDNCEKPRINIISNIQLRPPIELNFSVASPGLFKNGKPNANSTMINPWRFNEVNLTRNPHFITLKGSSLPSINQDMVLDHTLVDKFEESVITPVKADQDGRKTPVQKTLTEYFSSNKENLHQSSLFDNDLLSPIKNKSKFGDRVSTVKRKVLGERNENVKEARAVSTPLVARKDAEITDFGFSSLEELEEESKENLPVQENDQKPFRFSVNFNDKKYVPKKKVKIVERLSTSDEESEESDAESHSDEIRLFEEFETTKSLPEVKGFDCDFFF